MFSCSRCCSIPLQRLNLYTFSSISELLLSTFHAQQYWFSPFKFNHTAVCAWSGILHGFYFACLCTLMRSSGFFYVYWPLCTLFSVKCLFKLLLILLLYYLPLYNVYIIYTYFCMYHKCLPQYSNVWIFTNLLLFFKFLFKMGPSFHFLILY